jgi:ketosteroid isomerase-like protein
MPRKEWIMSAKENVEGLLEIFAAIERRDPQRVLELCCPDVEFHWPPSLPYGGVSRGLGGDRPTWSATWVPLQPTEAERLMDPRVVAATEEEVVVRWEQRGLSPTGDRFDGPCSASIGCATESSREHDVSFRHGRPGEFSGQGGGGQVLAGKSRAVRRFRAKVPSHQGAD